MLQVNPRDITTVLRLKKPGYPESCQTYTDKGKDTLTSPGPRQDVMQTEATSEQRTIYTRN
jgi:hypothetical protein